MAPTDTPPPAGATVLAPGAKLERLAGGFAFTEGPTADAAGNVYFTDQPNDRILRWGTDGTLSTLLAPSGRSNGLCFDAAGRLLACADARNELWSIDVATRAATVLVRGYAGRLLNGPNDVWAHPGGGAYFTDPFYARDYWSRGPAEQGGEHVYFLSPDRSSVVRVVDDLEKPNGVVGSPDGRTLYVADIGAGRTYAYAVNADGTLAGRRLFCPAGSDGITLDDEGHLYLTGGDGVTVFDRNGARVETIAVPGEGWTSNVCFGGADRRTLFVTAGTGLFAVRTRVSGAGPGRAAVAAAGAVPQS
jgi:gluconolactonase